MTDQVCMTPRDGACCTPDGSYRCCFHLSTAEVSSYSGRGVHMGCSWPSMDIHMSAMVCHFPITCVGDGAKPEPGDANADDPALPEKGGEEFKQESTRSLMHHRVQRTTGA